MHKGRSTFFKYVLFGLNFFVWLLGIALIVAGIVIEVYFKSYTNFLNGHDAMHNIAASLPIILIGIGCVVACIGFFGCFGTIQENVCMIITFAIMASICLALQLGIGVAISVLHGKASRGMRNAAFIAIREYGLSEDSFLGTKAWIQIQSELDCCGVDDYTDWSGSVYYNQSSSAPDSCCRETNANCADGALKWPVMKATKHIYTELYCLETNGKSWTPELTVWGDKGCFPKISAYITRNWWIWLVFGICSICIQVVGIVFAGLLAHEMLLEFAVKKY